MLIFRCPSCAQSYSVADSGAGQKFACRACGQRIQVPLPPASTKPAASQTSRASSAFLVLLAGAVVLCFFVVVGGVTLIAMSSSSASPFGRPPVKEPKDPAAHLPGPATTSNSKSDPAGDKLAKQAHDVLKTHCYRCHGEGGTAEGGLNFVLDLEKLVARGRVVPGDPAKSRLFRRVEKDLMPPEGEKPRPNAEEVAVLRRWIEAGAPPLSTVERPVAGLSTAETVELIHASLLSLPERDRRFARFFTLTHLANAGLRDDELETYRTVLSKLANSLSWNRKIVNPTPVDPGRTILRIDIRDYQWNDAIWKRVLAEYPYGILWDHPKAQECFDMAGGQLPFIRADWFIAHASCPPLYHEILQLPATEHELEKQLHIDVSQNIQQERVARAGFNGSGVSRNNRLIERHASPYGSYWRSYDFADNVGRKNLFAHPLGPAANDDKGFVPDGGEIIFSLPNGLHAFMLVDEKGQRLDRAPQSIVSDPKRPDRAVVNGISCMSCHTRGLIPKKDQVRPLVEKNPDSFSPQEMGTIMALYPPEKTLDALLQEDNARFHAAVKQTGVKLTKTEPISGLVARFEQELDLATAAAELGLGAKDFSTRLGESPALLRVLGPLRVAGGTVQRQVFTEAIPDLARELKLGRVVDKDR